MEVRRDGSFCQSVCGQREVKYAELESRAAFGTLGGLADSQRGKCMMMMRRSVVVIDGARGELRASEECPETAKGWWVVPIHFVQACCG
jgi:hypothetical protein